VGDARVADEMARERFRGYRCALARIQVAARPWLAAGGRLNGLLAAPLMATMLVIACNPRIMGALVLPRYLTILGWVGTAAMAAASVAMFALWVV